ncbi:Pol polyprotein [Plakobranchus ocellatus]|uniref:Pol polyprotein n=1 Tax=Plakobranchus ocellatus TaxID=259542 RepID=A0AAV3XSS9_9GAST|nr:Pol polyprotein [Plakobranchus ocellatus]
MERVHLDFLGPLPRNKAGNEAVLMIVDQFTKWFECLPLPSQIAEATASAAVERYKRTLLNAVRCYLQERQDRWDECVPLIAAALRTSVNRNTGFTPNRLMLGREVTTPLELMFPLPRAAVEGPLLDPYVSSLEPISNKHMLKPVRP